MKTKCKDSKNAGKNKRILYKRFFCGLILCLSGLVLCIKTNIIVNYMHSFLCKNEIKVPNCDFIIRDTSQ